MQRALKKLSFVIPVYNEEESLPALRSTLEEWVRKRRGLAVEILLVNDGSKDASLAFLKTWAADDKNVKVVSFSRNFGHQNAVTAGLLYCAGEAAAIIDADLQDPIAVIDEMIVRYEDGYDVVYGQRISREGENAFKKVSAWLFYRVMNYCMSIDMPKDTGDFRLVSRKAIDAVNAMPEYNRFLRSMFAWNGFKQIPVKYHREERKYGATKYPLRKMLSLAWNGITSFSIMPLRFITFLGVLTTALGFLSVLYTLSSLAMGVTVAGWTSLMCFLSFLGGVIMLSLGIIGEYIGKIYEEIKRRPAFIVDEHINIDSGGTPGRHDKQNDS
jgi:dolichol-phosphate mannosyltransferase